MKYALVLTVLAACAAPISTRQQAQEAVDRGDSAAAYELYADVVCASPDDLAASRAYVDAWSALGKPGTAHAKLACDLPDATRLYLAGLAHALMGRAEDAERAFVAAVADGAPRDDVALRRGLVALAAGQDTATALLGEAAALMPTRVDVRLAWAQALARGKDVKATREALVGLFALTPSAQELESARRILNNAVRASEAPLAPELVKLTTDALSAIQRSEAVQIWAAALEEAHRATPHERVSLALGFVMLKLGEAVRGRDLLEAAASQNPHSPEAVRALGLMLHASERTEEAYGYLQEAARRNPFDTEVQSLLAAVANTRGDRMVSQRAREQLLVLQPNVASHYVELTRLLRERSELASAQRVIERGMQVSRDDIPLLLERAAVYAAFVRAAPSESEKREARTRLELSIEDLLRVSPDHPGAAALRP